MEISIVAATSGVLGSLVGGGATIATAWVTQKIHSRREMIQLEVRKREALYGDFIGECGRLLIDALTHSLETPESLLPAHALLNRIRLTASGPVLAEAERLLMRITDQYFASNITVEEMGRIARAVDADPLKAFGEACRAELRALQARV
jgi:hypothetical protein